MALGFKRGPSTRFGEIYSSYTRELCWLEAGRVPKDTAYGMSHPSHFRLLDSCCPDQNKNIPLLSWSERIRVNKSYLNTPNGGLMGTYHGSPIRKCCGPNSSEGQYLAPQAESFDYRNRLNQKSNVQWDLEAVVKWCYQQLAVVLVGLYWPRTSESSHHLTACTAQAQPPFLRSSHRPPPR